MEVFVRQVAWNTGYNSKQLTFLRPFICSKTGEAKDFTFNLNSSQLSQLFAFIPEAMQVFTCYSLLYFIESNFFSSLSGHEY